MTEALTDQGSPAPDDPPEHAEVEPERPGRRIDRSLLVLIALLGIGSFILVRGVLIGITGDDRAALPPFVESVEPVPEAVQVLNQSNVFVDLATGYIGVLVIDGVELETVNIEDFGEVDAALNGEQIDLPPVTVFEAGNSTLTFTPSAGAPIEQFRDGDHTVQVVYWRLDEGRQRARSYSWTFTVV